MGHFKLLNITQLEKVIVDEGLVEAFGLKQLPKMHKKYVTNANRDEIIGMMKKRFVQSGKKISPYDDSDNDR